MIKFEGNIVQFGFGAVGKSFYEKISKEIKFDENKYFVITRDKYEFDAYINLGGMVENFVACEVTRENFGEIFEKYLNEGDLLIDFADTVGTRDILEWCIKRNIMYINTGEADWPDNWYSIFDENELKCKMREEYNDNKDTNRYPIILQHGNNPGLVSHFVKAGIEYIVNTQHKKDKNLKELIKNNRFNEVAQKLGIRMIHVNDIDLQEINGNYPEDTLISTWCTDSFLFEMLSEATFNTGTHEQIDFEDKCKYLDFKKGFLEFKKLAAETKCRTYYPNGSFEGFLVPHEETITIAKSLEVKEKVGCEHTKNKLLSDINNNTEIEEKVVYRPSVMFLYAPCQLATNYFKKAKVNEYPESDPNKPQDCENENGETIIRGYKYPNNTEIIYREKIMSGTEYVGVLLIGENFEPVWVGNRIEQPFLYKDRANSYWQTPTITPVAMSALAAVCWMLKHKEKGGVYFPDDIDDYKKILKVAEKYISKTIYKTFDKKTIKDSLKIDFNNLQSKDIFVE